MTGKGKTGSFSLSLSESAWEVLRMLRVVLADDENKVILLMQKLIEAGEVSEGLIAAEGYDDEIVDGMLNPHDDLNILVTLKASGSVEKTVIGSLAGRIKGYHLHNNF